MYSTINRDVLYATFGIAFTLALIIFKQDFWKLFFFGLILLSFSSLISFYHTTYFVAFGYISVDLIALGLAIIHLIVNGEMLSFFVRDHKGKDGNLSKQEKFEIKKTAGKITNFEKKFATKDKNELARIVKENRLVPEAIEAAIRLLEK